MTKFSIDKLFMKEVAYHISTGLSTRLHRKKKASRPVLHLNIGLYAIQYLKEVDAKPKDFKKSNFNTKSFNL